MGTSEPPEIRYPLNLNDPVASKGVVEALRRHFSPERVRQTGPAPASEDFGAIGTGAIAR